MNTNDAEVIARAAVFAFINALIARIEERRAGYIRVMQDPLTSPHALTFARDRSSLLEELAEILRAAKASRE